MDKKGRNKKENEKVGTIKNKKWERFFKKRDTRCRSGEEKN